MDEHPFISRKWLQRFSWGWFLIALWGAVMTPFAAISFYRDVVSGNRLLFLPMLLALLIRLGQIWLFFGLWLKYRPRSSEEAENRKSLLGPKREQKEKVV
jgi:hypothetical protein